MKRVLVVDDEFGLLEALGDVLSEAGYAITTARNGKDALKRFAEQQPDLVVCDYMMPVMDGAAFIAALKVLPGAERTPIILMTAVRRANLPHELAVAAVLQKPFSIDALLSTVKRVMGEG